MSDTTQATDRGGVGAQLAGEPDTYRLGDFVLRRELGTGGMGTVFLADNLADGSTVALKLINPVASGDHLDVARFVRESNFLLALDHPNIVKAFEVGAFGERYYLSMEYVPGGPLLQYILRDGRVEPNEALRIMRQIAHALEYVVLTVLIIRALRGARHTTRRTVWIAALLALVYAGLDEYHQSFVANRHPSVLDLLVDATAIGAVAIVAVTREQAQPS